MQKKRSEVTLKFNNFCAKNYTASTEVKFKVMQACFVSTILYSCKCWSDYIPNELEKIHQMAIRSAMSIRQNCCNEIIYIESGQYPLICEIKKRQYSFYKNLINSNEHGYFQKLIRIASERRITFVRYYENLLTNFHLLIIY